MKYSLILLLFFLNIIIFAEKLPEENIITIEEVFNLAKKNSPEYEFKSQDIDAKRSMVNFEYASFLPRIDYKYQNGKSNVDINKSALSSGRSIDVNPEMQSLNAELDISIHKIIPKINTIRLSKKVKDKDKSIFENDFQLSVSRIFLELIKAKKMYENAENYEKTLLKQVNLIGTQFKNKLNNSANLNESVKRLAIAKADKLNRKTRLIDIEKEYFMLIGTRHENFSLPKIDKEKFKTLEEYLLLVEKNNSKINQTLIKNNFLLSKLVAASLEFAPTVSISYNHVRESQVWYYLGTPAVVRQMALLNVNVPILDNGRTIQNVANSYYEKKIGYLESHYIKKKVLQDSEFAFNVYKNNLNTFIARKEAADKAKQNVELRRNELKFGLSSLYFLLEAEQDHIISLNQFIESEIDVIYSYFLLEYYVK